MTVVNLADRRKPVVYTIEITHHWDDTLEVFIHDVQDDPRSRASVEDTILRVAAMIAERRAPANTGAPE